MGERPRSPALRTAKRRYSPSPLTTLKTTYSFKRGADNCASNAVLVYSQNFAPPPAGLNISAKKPYEIQKGDENEL
jgi:hypothetical protein